MIVTVAICTWNRADSLRKTLASLVAATPPQGRWEVLVVNNNSTDHTHKVLDEFAALLPLRVILELRQGLSHARNAAVAAAAGRFMLWTDDDVLVDVNWLRGYEGAIARWPEASVFGGPIHPVFEGSPPDWLTEGWRLIAEAFAYRDMGETVVALGPGEGLPFGANYAVRTALQRLHRYDPDLGRSGPSGALGEEVSVLEALLKTAEGWWVPESKVLHRIPPARQTRAYVGRYYRMVGKTHAMLEAHEDTPMFLGMRRWAIRNTLVKGSAYFLRRGTRRPVGAWLPVYAQLHFALGSLRPTRRQGDSHEH